MSGAPKSWLDQTQASVTGTGPIDITSGVVSIDAATQNDPGSMSAADKKRVDRQQIWFSDYDPDPTGVADCAAKLQQAIDDAISSKVGVVNIHPGTFKFVSGVTAHSAVTLRGCGGPVPGGIEGAVNAFPTFLHAFDGDFIAFDGSTGGAATSGGGVEHLRIVQVFGGAADGIPRGVAIKITAIDDSHRPSWPVLRDLRIEESTESPWEWAIVIDGTNCPGFGGIPNGRIIDVSTHTGAGASGSIQLNGASGWHIQDPELHDTAGHISVTGTDPGSGGVRSTGVTITGGDCVDISCDWAASVTVTGTQCNSITHTVNTLGPSSFSPGQLTNSFADATGTDEAGAWWYDRAGLTDGYFRSSKGIAIPNSRPLTAVKFAGGNNKVRIVQLDVNDAIRICVNGDAITAIGAVASLSGLSNGDLTVQGTGRFEGLTASKVVITDASKNLSTIGYATAATVSTLVERDGSGNINVVGLNASGLTASQAVVTDGSKNLASLAYATAATADTIAKRTSAGCVVAAPQVATYTPGSTSFSVSGLGPTVVCFVSNSGATTINDITGGVAGTIVTMVFADANTTIDRSLNFTLDGAADFAATQYDTITLIKQASGNFWSEISRAVNG